MKRQNISPVHALKEEMKDREVLSERTFDLYDDGSLAVAISRHNKNYRVLMVTDKSGPLLLHWGIAVNTPFEWILPPASMLPSETVIIDRRAAQTPFVLHKTLNRLTLELSEENTPIGITFVLKEAETGRWLKYKGRNFFIPIRSNSQKQSGLHTSSFSCLAEEIIRAETEKNSWTLMHRFNLCHDLLERAGDDRNTLALLFVWLRYSSLRQLDWQRNYNTKPKELSHAQDRLTLKLADWYRNNSENRDILRLIFPTLGRGGQGQIIRDEILNIMHRHHIKEVSNHFMEEWHQKLHNNTTPDDIVICEAYLEFLRSNGNLSLFYETLETKGVPRERLENFERPIVTPPDFVHNLKEGLIHDFENYLKILKSIHSGTDLESAINAASYLFDSNMREQLNSLLHEVYENAISLLERVEKITLGRRKLGQLLSMNNNTGNVRDMLYLDLSLEEVLRLIIEGTIHAQKEQNQLVELIYLVLENLSLSYDCPELSVCSQHWEKLKGINRFGQDWSLHTKSVLDRIGRVIGTFSNDCYHLFQPGADLLGTAFHAEAWTINLFSEEVVRGKLTFILSMLIHHLDPILRKYARLGDWQVISPGEGSGIVEVTDTLRSIQGKTFEKPTVVIADRVMGDEEPPEGVCAIITPDAVDLVSHVAVRTRNSRLLFATCYDKECLKNLKSLRGHFLNFQVQATGDITFQEVAGNMTTVQPQPKIEVKKISMPAFSMYAIPSDHFSDSMVGSKSNNLVRLHGKLPEWINFPVSAALPFGVFEKVLALNRNKEITAAYENQLDQVHENPEKALPEIRKTLLTLEPPEELFSDLLRIMNLSPLQQKENVWMCIKRVWASKWNERAYLSRKARGIPDNNIFMAVLIQQLVEAEYAFVIHTQNPFTGDSRELYAEVVLGLGETLVSNYPGRALSFTIKKGESEINLISYPNKSIGLFGSGFIFRSDSNGEDLAGYAGAGLYDSVLLSQPRNILLQYKEEPLVWNRDFRQTILNSIAEIGIIVENLIGSPQDIEGAYAGGKYYIVQTRPQV